eukprot:TRINITY_DN15993_c0_g1_i1.p1 TRINITY_DN15993_c0_g1~~TRINITY_DN15993_c0_g1_i1.p1  ORF type:complete len:302 (+),score=15.57 TRINITY_DN15993_c0_g1_i1:58-906(+)
MRAKEVAQYHRMRGRMIYQHSLPSSFDFGKYLKLSLHEVCAGTLAADWKMWALFWFTIFPVGITYPFLFFPVLYIGHITTWLCVVKTFLVKRQVVKDFLTKSVSKDDVVGVDEKRRHSRQDWTSDKEEPLIDDEHDDYSDEPQNKSEYIVLWFATRVCNCFGAPDRKHSQKGLFWFGSPKFLLWSMHFNVLAHMDFFGIYVVLFIGEDHPLLAFIYCVMTVIGVFLSLWLMLPAYAIATSIGKLVRKGVLDEVSPIDTIREDELDHMQDRYVGEGESISRMV